MDTSTGIIAVVPAFAARKDVLTAAFLGVPLLEQTLRFAGLCSEVTRTYAATADPSLQSLVRAAGARVLPFEMAEDDPGATLLEHFFEIETNGEWFRWVLWLDPTRPLRDRFSVLESYQRCIINGEADGIVSVSPWAGGGEAWSVTDEGWLRPAGDAPPGKRWRVDGMLSLLRADAYRNDPIPMHRMNCMAYFTTPASATTVTAAADVPAAEKTAREHPADFDWLLKGQVR